VRRWLLAGLLLGGCAHVRPWQRELLADPAIREPPCAQLRRAELHALEIREATRGGFGSAGGGCGCN
jgi:hypothetical protein